MPAFELYVRGLTAASEELQERYLAQAIDAAPGYVEARLALWDGAVGARRPRPGGGDAEGRRRRPMPHALDAGIRTAASLVQLRRYDEAFAALQALAVGTPLGGRHRT